MRIACKNGEHDACDHTRTSERIVVARAHHRPPAWVPRCRSDSFVMFTIRTERCRAPFWLVELLDVLEPELKNAIAFDLLARVRTEIISMGDQ
jgi:hypothetical protein